MRSTCVCVLDLRCSPRPHPFSAAVFRHHQAVTEDVFDKITPTTLNAALTKLMPGLSAKVFRTYNASIVLETELKALDIGATKEEKVRRAVCLAAMTGARGSWACVRSQC